MPLVQLITRYLSPYFCVYLYLNVSKLHFQQRVLYTICGFSINADYTLCLSVIQTLLTKKSHYCRTLFYSFISYQPQSFIPVQLLLELVRCLLTNEHHILTNAKIVKAVLLLKCLLLYTRIKKSAQNLHKAIRQVDACCDLHYSFTCCVYFSHKFHSTNEAIVFCVAEYLRQGTLKWKAMNTEIAAILSNSLHS